jgi:hypothetical protein
MAWQISSPGILICKALRHPWSFRHEIAAM